MLILTRRRGEILVIGDNIRVMVTAVRGKYIDIGIDAPRDIFVHRAEVYEKIQQEEAHRNECSDADCTCGGNDKDDNR